MCSVYRTIATPRHTPTVSVPEMASPPAAALTLPFVRKVHAAPLSNAVKVANGHSLNVHQAAAPLPAFFKSNDTRPSANIASSGSQLQPLSVPIHSTSVIETFRHVLSTLDMDDCEPNAENAFLVCDLKRVMDRYTLWQEQLGNFGVEAFFAVKCNPDPVILRMMAKLGLGFDCASHAEISSVLAYGVSPEKIIYANPAKAASFIRHAARQNVEMMTFDNGDELVKIAKYHPCAKMVLRILTDDSGSLCKLGLKFGAPLSQVKGLLQKAKSLNIDVIGISFHVGSGCTNPHLFGDAVQRAHWAFKVGKQIGYDFTLLDIGGGFGGENFVEIAGILRPVLDQYFPRQSADGSVEVDEEAFHGIRIIAEPGRYFVAEAFEMGTNIIARRARSSPAALVSSSLIDAVDIKEADLDVSVETLSMTASSPTSTVTINGEGEKTTLVHDVQEAEDEPITMYYVNDGVYGSFNCIMFDHQVVFPKVMTLDGEFVKEPRMSSSEFPAEGEEACSIWGPTCDSIDCVSKMCYLPTNQLVVGDWLRWENMGAYTVCAASQFNGFKQSRVVYTIDADEHDEALIRNLLA
ncbi:Ornithine decarboxylase [Cystobasidiomycetes sp. EMM_F5]